MNVLILTRQYIYMRSIETVIPTIHTRKKEEDKAHCIIWSHLSVNDGLHYTILNNYYNYTNFKQSFNYDNNDQVIMTWTLYVVMFVHIPKTRKFYFLLTFLQFQNITSTSNNKSFIVG